jgi:polyhydroxyalkanoate synthesis regulator phasin
MTESEAAAFWPLFDDYQQELAPLRERSARLAAEYVDAGGQLSDQRAHAMVTELLAADEQTLALRRKYMKRMERALPPRKVAQFFQLDRKLDAVVAYEYAQRIPLMR